MFSFNPEKLIVDQPLGRGGSSTIYPYRKTMNDERWVVKHLVTSNPQIMLKHINEIVLGFSLDHQFVLPVQKYDIRYDPVLKNYNTYLKISRMKETLRQKVDRLNKEKKPLSEKEIIQHFYALSSGLAYMHRRKISHNDIKLENILIDSEGGLKIVDIGIGELLDGNTSFDVLFVDGTLPYLAPEMLERSLKLKKRDLLKADAWSLGVVMAELCLLKPQLIDVAARGETKELEFARYLEQVKKRYSRGLIELIKSLLKANSKERKSVEEVYLTLKKKYPFVLVNTVLLMQE